MVVVWVFTAFQIGVAVGQREAGVAIMVRLTRAARLRAPSGASVSEDQLARARRCAKSWPSLADSCATGRATTDRRAERAAVTATATPRCASWRTVVPASSGHVSPSQGGVRRRSSRGATAGRGRSGTPRRPSGRRR
jgi:hypothetical protein